MPVKAIYAPVSGCLIAGTLVSDFEVTRALAPTQTYTPHGCYGELYDLDEQLAITNIYRLFGHDIVLRDQISGFKKHPWAPVRECLIEPASITFDPENTERLVFVSSEQREGRYHTLPGIVHMLKGGPIHVVFMQPTISINYWGCRTTPLRPVVSVNRVKTEVKFLVKAPLTYNTVGFTAREIKRTPVTGFRTEQSVATSMKPEGAIVRTKDTIDALMAQHGTDVRTADSKLKPPTESVTTASM